MEKEAIESLVFTQKSKNELIVETMGSLQDLLNGTFSDKDNGNLKMEFPENTHLEDLSIKLDNVVIYIEGLTSPGLSIEVILDIFLRQNNFELGTYSHIFNEDGNLIDELLVIN
jgi:hypothetical protein